MAGEKYGLEAKSKEHQNNILDLERTQSQVVSDLDSRQHLLSRLELGLQRFEQFFDALITSQENRQKNKGSSMAGATAKAQGQGDLTFSTPCHITEWFSKDFGKIEPN